MRDSAELHRSTTQPASVLQTASSVTFFSRRGPPADATFGYCRSGKTLTESPTMAGGLKDLELETLEEVVSPQLAARPPPVVRRGARAESSRASPST